MHIHEASEYLYIGTYGRSMYKLDIADDVLSITNVDFDEGISIYPNPASDFVNISMPLTSEKVTIELFDQLGRQLLMRNFSEVRTSKRISIEGIPQGVYFVRISDGSSRTTKKLLVK